jgi:hypothetical protein
MAREPPDAVDVPELRDEITAVEVVGDVLVVATRDRVIWREQGAGSREQDQLTADSAAGRRQPAARGGWTVERNLNGELGRLTCIAADPTSVWLGGASGFALYRFATRQFTFFNAPGDVPGAVRDMVADERYVWVAADGGVVRFQRRALVP